MKELKNRTFSEDALLGLHIMFQIRRCHPDFDTLSNMLHSVREDDLRVLVILDNRYIQLVESRIMKSLLA